MICSTKLTKSTDDKTKPLGDGKQGKKLLRTLLSPHPTHWHMLLFYYYYIFFQMPCHTSNPTFQNLVDFILYSHLFFEQFKKTFFFPFLLNTEATQMGDRTFDF